MHRHTFTLHVELLKLWTSFNVEIFVTIIFFFSHHFVGVKTSKMSAFSIFSPISIPTTIPYTRAFDFVLLFVCITCRIYVPQRKILPYINVDEHTAQRHIFMVVSLFFSVFHPNHRVFIQQTKKKACFTLRTKALK